MVNEHKNQKRGKKADILYVADMVLGSILIFVIIIIGIIFAFAYCAGKLFKKREGRKKK